MRLTIAVLSFLLLTLPLSGAYLKSEFHELDHDAERHISRTYVVHAPRSYDEKTLWPVVLVIHGRGGFPGTVARQSQMNALADQHGFLAVYPEGTGQPDNGSFNAGRCCGDAVKRQIDDVGFIRDILDDLQSHFRVDPNRIYATGMSNGASMAFRVGSELSDRIAAIAPVSGDQGIDAPRPMRPVPVVCFYGMKDPYLNYSTMWKTIQWWLYSNHCQTTPVEVVQKTDFVMERYEPANGVPGASVVFYKIREGGHTWPGGVDINRGPGAGPTIATLPASEIMWEFFERHPRVLPK